MSRRSVCALLAAVLCAAGMFVPGVSVRAEETARKYVVVLDPGHGGEEAGAQEWVNGTLYDEKYINWRISVYTKQALKDNPDIDVYMTRNTYNKTMGLTERVMRAKAHGADLLVSQHINDYENASARGASVLISRGTYRPELHTLEKQFGAYVMKELGALGIYQRHPETGGMEYRMSENGSTYPNGAARDYYSIVAESVEQDIPGVIIEHAFISNPSDAVSFLSSETKLKALGEADARAIVKYFKWYAKYEKKLAAQKIRGWSEEDGEYYYYESGVKQKKRFLYLNSGTYYVDKMGRRVYGWKTIGGRRYYFNKDGTAHTGWLQYGKNRYYFYADKLYRAQDTVVKSGSGRLYFFGPDGKCLSGWQDRDGRRYYIGEKYYALTGLQTIGGRKYFFDVKDAYLYVNKKITVDGRDIYYANKKGVLYTKGFKTLRSGGRVSRYYFRESGKAALGWLKVDGKWYYFGMKDGVMYRDTTVTTGKATYVFDADGVCISGKA